MNNGEEVKKTSKKRKAVVEERVVVIGGDDLFVDLKKIPLKRGNCVLIGLNLNHLPWLSNLHEELKRERPEQAETFRYFGREIKHPRLHRQYLDDYTFSGVTHKGLPREQTPPMLLKFVDYMNKLIAENEELRQELFLKEGEAFKFNSALVNWYRNGHDYIAAHQDKGEPHCVLTLTLGDSNRVLRVRRLHSCVREQEVQLKHGLVYLMCGANFQRLYTHEIPKISGQKGAAIGERISVTLRQH